MAWWKNNTKRRYGRVFFSLFIVGMISLPCRSPAASIYLPIISKIQAKPLQNGSFDQGPDGSWQETSTSQNSIVIKASDIPSVPNQPNITAHSGEWVAWLGGLDGETSTLSQTIIIPDNAAALHYYYWIESYEAASNCGFDKATVLLGGSVLTAYDLCETTNTGGWKGAQWDISAYRGQALELVFQLVNDSVDWSNLYIDTVTISTK